jgi:hypothetical protein
MRRAVIVSAALCVLAVMAAVLLIPPTEETGTELAVGFGCFGLAFVVVGAVLATRLPGNAVGWMMLAIGVLTTLLVITGQYAGYALFGEGDGVPGGRAAAWAGSWLYGPALGLLVVLILVFPRGRLEGRSPRWLARLLGVAAGAGTVAQALVPGPMDGFDGVANPLGIERAGTALDAVLAVANLVLALGLLVAAGSLVARLRGARGDERLQLKWFAYAAGVFVVASLLNILPLGLDSSTLGFVLVVLGLLALPVSIGVAVLKYRLYDIDRVINRTLVYGGLSATLAGGYVGLVLLLGLVLSPVTQDSGLAIAASTLAVAALFRPARARIQAAVDRRFYRSRYDAALTLEAFSGRLREQVDLEALGSDLRAVIDETMQPAHTSLWLRSPR